MYYCRFLLFAAAFTVLFGNVADAATFFDDDFTGGPSANWSATLGGPGAGPVDYTSDNALFVGGDADRVYVTTVDTDYATTSFVAEITTTATSGGGGSPFFGLGTGAGVWGMPPWGEPDTAPSLFIRARGQGFAGDRFDLMDTVSDGIAEAHSGDENTAGGGTHRLRLAWDANAQSMTASIHQNYEGGPFVATATVGPIDGSDNGFDASNARIFFGATNDVTFDDFSVIPEPASAVLLFPALMGLAAFVRRSRK